MTSVQHWRIGDVTVTRVEERVTPVAWERLVPDGQALVADARPWIDPFVSTSGSHLLLSVHSFVVQTPQTLIVVDTCVGPKDSTLPGDPAFGARLADSIPGGTDAVGVVICTHLHFDHVGWNTIERDGQRVPMFANAKYLLSEDELAAERDDEDTASYNASIEPLNQAGCLQPVESSHRVDDYVSLEPSAGHTPGHVSVRITSAGSQALITGDIVHSPIQLANPDASSTPDVDPPMAIATRKRYIDELLASETLILGSHFGPPTAGHLTRNAHGAIEFS
jgi:glyoxylase-like metal-dependent hydrolase (beta-lactamase superfamily II)